MIKIDYVKREQLPGDNIGQQIVKATINGTTVVLVTGFDEHGVIWVDQYRSHSMLTGTRLRDAGRMGVTTIRSFDPSLDDASLDWCEDYVSALIEWTGINDGWPSLHDESRDATGLLEEVFEDTTLIAGRKVSYGGLVIAGRGYLAVCGLDAIEVGGALHMAGDAAMAPKCRDTDTINGYGAGTITLVPLEASLVLFRDDLNVTFPVRAEAEARAMMTVVADYLNKLYRLGEDQEGDGFEDDCPYGRKWRRTETEE